MLLLSVTTTGRREALLLWKQRCGDSATYNNLISSFESAGYQEHADFIKQILLVQEVNCAANERITDHSEVSPPSSTQQKVFPNIVPKVVLHQQVCNPAREKENNVSIEAMEVDCLGLGDEDSSDTTESDWGSDLENSERGLCDDCDSVGATTKSIHITAASSLEPAVSPQKTHVCQTEPRPITADLEAQGERNSFEKMQEQRYKDKGAMPEHFGDTWAFHQKESKNAVDVATQVKHNVEENQEDYSEARPDNITPEPSSGSAEHFYEQKRLLKGSTYPVLGNFLTTCAPKVHSNDHTYTQTTEWPVHHMDIDSIRASFEPNNHDVSEVSETHDQPRVPSISHSGYLQRYWDDNIDKYPWHRSYCPVERGDWQFKHSVYEDEDNNEEVLVKSFSVDNTTSRFGSATIPNCDKGLSSSSSNAMMDPQMRRSVLPLSVGSQVSTHSRWPALPYKTKVRKQHHVVTEITEC